MILFASLFAGFLSSSINGSSSSIIRVSSPGSTSPAGPGGLKRLSRMSTLHEEKTTCAEAEQAEDQQQQQQQAPRQVNIVNGSHHHAHHNGHHQQQQAKEHGEEQQQQQAVVAQKHHTEYEPVQVFILLHSV